MSTTAVALLTGLGIGAEEPFGFCCRGGGGGGGGGRAGTPPGVLLGGCGLLVAGSWLSLSCCGGSLLLMAFPCPLCARARSALRRSRRCTSLRRASTSPRRRTTSSSTVSLSGSSLSLLLMALLTGAGAGTGSCLLAAVAMVVVVVGVVLGLAFAPGAAAGDCLALGGGGLDARVRAAAGDGDGELPLLLTICCFMLAAGDYLADAIWISLCWRWNADHGARGTPMNYQFTKKAAAGQAVDKHRPD